MFLANYSDGLTDAPLPEMIELLQEERQARLLPRRAPAAHLPSRRVRRRRRRASACAPAHDSDIWINGGYFVFRNRDLRLHQGRRGAGGRAVPAPDRRRPAHGLPPRRLLARHGHAEGQADPRGHGREGQHALAARSVEQAAWRRPNEGPAAGRARRAPVACCAWAPIPTTSRSAPAPRSCSWQARGVRLDVIWCVLSATGRARGGGARQSAAAFLAGRRARPHRGPRASATASFPPSGADDQGLVRDAQGPRRSPT